MGLLLLVHHHQIARQDARVQHGLTPHTQSKVLAVLAAGVEGQIILDALLGQDRRTRGHRAHDGHPSHRRLRLLHLHRSGGLCRTHQRDGPTLAARPLDDPALLHVFQMKVHRRRGLQSHRRADLTDGGGKPFLSQHLNDVVINFLLHFRHFCHKLLLPRASIYG